MARSWCCCTFIDDIQNLMKNIVKKQEQLSRSNRRVVSCKVFGIRKFEIQMQFCEIILKSLKVDYMPRYFKSGNS